MTIEFLTEPEVANLLRCSTSRVKRLRLSGMLAYFPGRPVMIQRADLDEYLASVRVASKPASLNATPQKVDVAAARTWALNIALKPQRFRRKAEPKS